MDTKGRIVERAPAVRLPDVNVVCEKSIRFTQPIFTGVGLEDRAECTHSPCETYSGACECIAGYW
jgi:hypothetical protein